MGAPFAARLVDRRGAVWLLPLAIVHGAAILALWGARRDRRRGGCAGGRRAGRRRLVPAVRSRPALALAGAPGRRPRADPRRLRVRLRHDRDLVRQRPADHGRRSSPSRSLRPRWRSRPCSSLPERCSSSRGCRTRAARSPRASTLPGLGPLRVAGDPADRPDLDARWLLHRQRRGGHSRRSARRPATPRSRVSCWPSGRSASGVGGLIFGARQCRRELLDSYLLIGLLFPLACLPLIAAGLAASRWRCSWLLAGAPIAPLIATRNELISQVAPQGTGTEAFTWLMTALIAGLSLGTAVAGAVIESSGLARGRPDRRGRRRRRRDHRHSPGAGPCGPRWPRPEPRLAAMDVELLERTLAERGEPSYRAGQVWEWAARGAGGYEEMTNLPAALRTELERGRSRTRR